MDAAGYVTGTSIMLGKLKVTTIKKAKLYLYGTLNAMLTTHTTLNADLSRCMNAARTDSRRNNDRQSRFSLIQFCAISGPR